MPIGIRSLARGVRPKSPRGGRSPKRSPKKTKRPRRLSKCTPKLKAACDQCWPQILDTRDARARERQKALSARMKDPNGWIRGILAGMVPDEDSET